MEQIAEIAKTLGMTYTQVLVLAIDRMAKEEKTK